MQIKRRKLPMLDLGKVDEGTSKASKGAAESKKIEKQKTKTN